MKGKAKFWVALAAACVAALLEGAPESWRVYLQPAALILGAVLVYLTPNTEGVNALTAKLEAAKAARRP